MIDPTLSTPFDLTGEFGGIVFTDAGKRRLLLRCGDGQEWLLKVPKTMRRRMAGNFRPGQTIRVAGAEERDPFTGASKWAVTAVLPVVGEEGVGEEGVGESPVVPPPVVAMPAVAAGPIRVCAKKNCGRQGGREIFAALERGLAERGLEGEVRIKAVSCLDRCKQAPNVDWGGREWTRCTARDVESILEGVKVRASAPGGPTSPES